MLIHSDLAHILLNFTHFFAIFPGDISLKML
jgi:hypothetical protein